MAGGQHVHETSLAFDFIGFLYGKLQLFQLRPFLESRKARGSNYLSNMDQSLQGSLDRTVNMQEVPNE